MKSTTDVPSLPPHYYHDQKIYEKEMERFFLDRWLPIAREEDVAGPGEFVIRNIGPESVIVIRGQDGKVGAFHNVCRHRGSRLIEEEKGSREVVQCGYHAWTYGLDGHLVGAPYMEGIEGFKMEDYGLIPVRLESWQGFLFVNLGPGLGSLRGSLGDLFDKLSRFRFGEFRRACHVTYEVKANWKILAENNLECYHCPTVHPKLVQIVKWDSWRGEGTLCGPERLDGIYSGASLTYREELAGVTASGKREFDPSAGASDPISERLTFYCIFPVLQINLSPDNLAAHYFWPDGPDRTRIEFEIYFDPRIAADSQYVKDTLDQWDVINREDWHVSELNHKGTASKFARTGVFNNYEFLVEDFDRYILESLDGEASSPK